MATSKKPTKARSIAAPPDLAKALEANGVAKAAWEKLPPSHRREHVDAIEEAKKPETRARRIAGAIAMLTSKPGR
jgi:uncharacterized protein YdeI (YjbR/CyaY-like superfamily)